MNFCGTHLRLIVPMISVRKMSLKNILVILSQHFSKAKELNPKHPTYIEFFNCHHLPCRCWKQESSNTNKHSGWGCNSWNQLSRYYDAYTIYSNMYSIGLFQLWQCISTYAQLTHWGCDMFRCIFLNENVSRYRNQWWLVSLLTHVCATRPQWINAIPRRNIYSSNDPRYKQPG